MAKVQTFHTLLSSLTAGVRLSVCHVVFSRVVALPQECKCVCARELLHHSFGITFLSLTIKKPSVKTDTSNPEAFYSAQYHHRRKKKEQSHPPNKSEELMQCAL